MKKRNWLVVFGVFAVLATIGVIAQVLNDRSSAPERFTATVAEGQTYTKQIVAYDEDLDDTLTITSDSLPAGASLGATIALPDTTTDPDIPQPSGPVKWFGATLTWTPGYDQSGPHVVYFKAEDDKSGYTWIKSTITVTNTNRAPVM